MPYTGTGGVTVRLPLDTQKPAQWGGFRALWVSFACGLLTIVRRGSLSDLEQLPALEWRKVDCSTEPILDWAPVDLVHPAAELDHLLHPNPATSVHLDVVARDDVPNGHGYEPLPGIPPDDVVTQLRNVDGVHEVQAFG